MKDSRQAAARIPGNKPSSRFPGLSGIEPATRQELLETAVSIGRRLVRTARRQGNACSWTVKVSDRDQPEKRQAKDELAGGNLYQGTAGIALFLGELQRVLSLRDRTLDGCADTALGAVRHALEDAGGMQASASGFHGGRTGVAYAAMRLADLLGRPRLTSQALEVLRPLQGQVRVDSSLDVIGGAAGAIPALLWMAGQIGEERLVDLAAEMGDHLIRTAHREPFGWCWRTVGDSAVRLLNGLAHGVSGFSNALLELWKAGCGERFRLAAEMGFLYERHFFDAQESNWPDLRNKEIADDLFYGRQEDLRRKAAQDGLQPFEAKCMTAWCHGSPGIGLARLRAWELTGQDVYRQEAEAALVSTLASLSEAGNYSLCHGLGGNADLLVAASRMLGRPQLLRTPLKLAAVGRRLYEEAARPWPCGTVNSENDPSLLLGEAGIGYFHLRLLEASVPPVLLLGLESGEQALSVPVTASKAHSQSGQGPGYQDLEQSCVDHYFARTLAGLKALGVEARPPLPSTGSGRPLALAPSEAAFQHLCGLTESPQDSTRRQLLGDLFSLDRVRYQMTRRLEDYTQEFLRSLNRPPAEEVDLAQDRFHLLPDSRLLSTRWNWDAWLEAPVRRQGAESAQQAARTPAAGPAAPEPSSSPDAPKPPQAVPPLPPEEDRYYLLYRKENRIQVRPLGVLAWVVLGGLEDPLTASQAARHAGQRLDVEGLSRNVLREKVARQMETLFQAGLIDVVRSRVPEAAAG